MTLCFGNCLVFECLAILLCLCSIVPTVENYDYVSDKLAPIILVNGVSDSQIEGKWDTRGHPKLCKRRETEWESLWLNPDIAIKGPIHQRCWAFRFQLLYDRSTRKCMNRVGVETRVKGRLGSLSSSEFLTADPITQQLPMSQYFHKMVKALENSGYSSDSSLKAHSYDWRYAPPRQDDFNYYKGFTELVEIVADQTKRKVLLVAHSMGGLVTAHFLMNKPQEWKDKYIHAFLTVGTPWLGSPKAISNYIVGNTYGIPTMDKKIMLGMVRTFQSIAFLLPEEKEFEDATLVEWVPQNKKYTTKDYQQFFKDVLFEDGYLMREDVRPFFPVALDKLGVKFYCVWTNLTELQTPGTYRVTAPKISDTEEVEIVNIVGDGTVPLNSLRYCEKFQSANVVIQNFQGYEHTGVLYETVFHDYVMSVAKGAQSFP
ncbi:unnamed protein product [Bemisia tabaci]|uniref:Uncharacterized protein n=1 Tax=Bemisia tabaci TaxID=7038 RepID=A0A9P0ABZ7_BEMTA|nr:unnamed protein product [Bemisia tabaci]